MTSNLNEERMEQSQICRENSRITQERASMSSADDVLEMRELCAEIANREAVGASAKERITAVSHALGVGWNRALEFLTGKARRADAWEMDNARRRVLKLRDRERIAQEQAHVLWLQSELGRLRASGEDFHGAHVDALEHLLRGAGERAGTVALQEAPEDHDQSAEWGGYQQRKGS